MAKCKIISKGDVQVDGVDVADGIVFRKEYASHTRGPAIFYNNRHGGKCVVYTEDLSVFDQRVHPAVEKKFRTEKAMDKFTLAILNTDNSED